MQIFNHTGIYSVFSWLPMFGNKIMYQTRLAISSYFISLSNLKPLLKFEESAGFSFIMIFIFPHINRNNFNRK